MGDERVLEKDALRFADAIHQFAVSKGWTPSEYHILMRVRSDIYTLSIIVAAAAYEGRTEGQEHEDYDDVMDFIEARVKRGSHHFNFYGLVLTGKDNFSFYANPRLGPDEFEIDEKLINDGESWSDPFRPKIAAKRAK